MSLRFNNTYGNVKIRSFSKKLQKNLKQRYKKFGQLDVARKNRIGQKYFNFYI